jgi:hypothetical protein
MSISLMPLSSLRYRYDTNLIPEAVKLYERLNVKHEPLSLIPPQVTIILLQSLLVHCTN